MMHTALEPVTRVSLQDSSHWGVFALSYQPLLYILAFVCISLSLCVCGHLFGLWAGWGKGNLSNGALGTQEISD